MDSARADPGVKRAASFVARVVRAAGRLSSQQRLAAIAALSLFLTLFLPWYSVTLVAVSKVESAKHQLDQLPATSFTGWGAFSFVEAAVLVVAIGVLVLLFRRAEGRAFHLPGGDGTVITVAGAWTCFLVIWRMFDKQGVTSSGQVDLSSGIQWGIFVALLAAAFLTYAGTRLRAARRPEPPLATEGGAVFDGRWRDPEHPPTGNAHSSPERRAPVERRFESERRPRDAGRYEPESWDEGRAQPERAPVEHRPGAVRSAWRPAERPEWSDPDERSWQSDWRERDRDPRDRPPPDVGSDQLTIPLEPGDDGR